MLCVQLRNVIKANYLTLTYENFVCLLGTAVLRNNSIVLTGQDYISITFIYLFIYLFALNL